MKNKSVLNLVFNLLGFLLSIGLSFWITPFIIKSIGAEGYGFIPLTQQLVNYMTVMTVSITSISGRFYTIAKQRGDLNLAQEYFSSSLFAGIIGSVILTIPLLVCTLFIDKILDIPLNLLFDVRFSLLIFGLIFFCGFITNGFNIGAFSRNELYITSTISIVNIIVKTLVTVLLLYLFIPKIWFVSIGALAAALISMIMTIVVFKKYEPFINVRKIKGSKLKEMLSSGIWVSLSEIGVILFLQIDLLVANWSIGAKLAGEYAVVLQLPAILRTFSGTIISIFVPTIISFYAVNKLPDMIKYINNSIRYTGLALALPIGIVCGFGGLILKLWINPSYEKYSLILIILTAHLSVNLPVQIIISVQTAVNKLKIPAFVTLIMGALNFILAIILSKTLGLGALGIAIAGSVILTFKNLIFTPIYVAYITNQKWSSYLKGVWKTILSFMLVSLICFFIGKNIFIKNILQLFVVCGIISIFYIIYVYFCMINKQERRWVFEFVRRKAVRK